MRIIETCLGRFGDFVEKFLKGIIRADVTQLHIV